MSFDTESEPFLRPGPRKGAQTVSLDSSDGLFVDKVAHCSGEFAAPSKQNKKGHSRAVVLEKLKNLRNLRSFDLITEDEYEDRKKQLVDKFTGTTGDNWSFSSSTFFQSSVISKSFTHVPSDFLPPDFYPCRRSTQRWIDRECKDLTAKVHESLSLDDSDDPWLTARGPSDFSSVPGERALKYVFDTLTREWVQTDVVVKIESSLFAKGSIRDAFHMIEIAEEGDVSCVAKFSRDPEEEDETYFRDAWMQMFSRQFAEKYNSFHPPKAVSFIRAWVLELIDRPHRPLCGVERYITGAYRKHNNNNGYVSEIERNTPQAFSHFTFEASRHRILICDIQGVNDKYTDPQVHSLNESEFGKGNLGHDGFSRFLDTHRCNAICRYLKLPSINAKTVEDQGTVPETRFMSESSVEGIFFHNPLPEKYPASPSDPRSPQLFPIAVLQGKEKRPRLFKCCVVS